MFGPQISCLLTKSNHIWYISVSPWYDVSHTFRTSAWPWPLASISKLYFHHECVCLWFFVFYLYGDVNITGAWRTAIANFDLCSTLMDIEQWWFFNVTHLLWHGTSVYVTNVMNTVYNSLPWKMLNQNGNRYITHRKQLWHTGYSYITLSCICSAY